MIGLWQDEAGTFLSELISGTDYKLSTIQTRLPGSWYVGGHYFSQQLFILSRNAGSNNGQTVAPAWTTPKGFKMPSVIGNLLFT